MMQMQRGPQSKRKQQGAGEQTAREGFQQAIPELSWEGGSQIGQGGKVPQEP